MHQIIYLMYISAYVHLQVSKKFLILIQDYFLTEFTQFRIILWEGAVHQQLESSILVLQKINIHVFGVSYKTTCLF